MLMKSLATLLPASGLSAIGLSAALLAGAIPVAGDAAQPGQGAHRKTDQGAAYDQLRRGEARPLREIEQRVIPRMPGATYLGPELHDDRYRLKFMENGAVIWVDVDARTGAIVGRTGD